MRIQKCESYKDKNIACGLGCKIDNYAKNEFLTIIS